MFGIVGGYEINVELARCPLDLVRECRICSSSCEMPA